MTTENKIKETKETKPAVEAKKETTPKVEKPKIDGGYGKATAPYQPARIQLKDGKVIAGIRFLRDIAKLSEKDSCADYAASYWLGTTEKGVATLKKFEAKIVYGMALTPKPVPPKPEKPAKTPKTEKAVKETKPAPAPVTPKK